MRTLGVRQQHIYIILAAVVVAFIFLNSDMFFEKEKFKDLRNFVKEIWREPLKVKEPLPEFKTIQSATYLSEAARDPFTTPEQEVSIADKSHKKVFKTALENYSLSALTLVGVVSISGKNWAVLKAPDGKVYRASIGTKIGENGGEIVKILENSIRIMQKKGDNWKTDKVYSITLTPEGGNDDKI